MMRMIPAIIIFGMMKMMISDDNSIDNFHNGNNNDKKTPTKKVENKAKIGNLILLFDLRYWSVLKLKFPTCLCSWNLWTMRA